MIIPFISDKMILYGISLFRRTKMVVSYKKLWKLLIDKDMKKSDLEREGSW